MNLFKIILTNSYNGIRMKKLLKQSFIIIAILITNNELNAQNINTSIYELPDILISNDGEQINSVEDWEEIRRPEILELFKKYVYGKINDQNLNVKYNVLKTNNSALNGKAIQKEVIVSIFNKEDTLNMNILIYLPRYSKKPYPIFLGMNFYGNHTINPDINISITQNYVNNKPEFCITNNQASHLSRGVRANRWPIDRIIERGYGIASIYYGDLDPDYDDGFQNGLHKLLNNSNLAGRGADEGGAISAWAYGLSKAIDYFETDNDINKNQVIVLGHSRLGKTALWAGAVDQRIAITISNDSGCGGAALSRRKTGETLFDINSKFPHWFCKNFHDFNNKEDDLPVDQHMLLALISPRPVYIASAVNDKWADPEGEYLSLYYAGPAYSLYGENILDNKNLPELNQPVIRGKLGYHIRSGSHDLTKYDWERYMDFADLHFSK